METRWALHECASCPPPTDSESDHAKLVTEFGQALLFGHTARTCQHATWRLSMAGELATSVGVPAASAVIDLAKAIEHIQFPCSWKMGVKHGFPLRLLRFLIGVCGGCWFLRVENVVTKVVSSGGSAVVEDEHTRPRS